MIRSRAFVAATVSLLAGVLSVAVAVDAAASPGRCTVGDVRKMIHAGPQGAEQYLFDGKDGGVGRAWAACQFRLYDDNDLAGPDSPEVPHVFSSEDWFMAGVLLFATRDDLIASGVDRRGAIVEMEQVGDRFFFGPSGGPLVEIPLQQTNYRSASASLGWIVVNHRYFVFEAGSLLPGNYEWRYEQTAPDLADPFVARGAVTITGGS